VLKIGLLGAGRIGNVHAQAIAAHPDCELAAVSDAFEQNAIDLAAKFDSVVRDTSDIIADKAINSVLIATPTDTHSNLIEAATAAGKSVLCEKPIENRYASDGRVQSSF